MMGYLSISQLGRDILYRVIFGTHPFGKKGGKTSFRRFYLTGSSLLSHSQVEGGGAKNSIPPLPSPFLFLLRKEG